MEVSGCGRFISGGKNNGTHCVYKAEWALELVWASWRKEKSLAAKEIRSPDHPAIRLVAIPTELSRFLICRNPSKIQLFWSCTSYGFYLKYSSIGCIFLCNVIDIKLWLDLLQEAYFQRDLSQNYIQYLPLPYSFSQFHGVVHQISSQIHIFGQQDCYTNVNECQWQRRRHSMHKYGENPVFEFLFIPRSKWSP